MNETANREQASYWNEEGGPRWVAMQRDLDAELEPFGIAVANALELRAGEKVVDVGCGAGATSLMLAKQVHPGHVLGIDISAPLITRARERVESTENVRFELADAQTYAFSGGAYDAVFSRFGVMFFADPIRAFSNLRGALRAGGKLGFICWRPMQENPAFVLPLQAALPFLPEAPRMPEPDEPGPFAFADQERIRHILRGAGYNDINVRAHDQGLVYAGRSDIEGAVDLALMIGPLSRAAPSLTEAARAKVRQAIHSAFAPYHGPAGVTLPSATWIVTARCP